MEFYLVFDRLTTISKSGTERFVSSVKINRDNLIQHDIKSGRIAVDTDTTNEQIIQLKECVGLLKDADNWTSQHCKRCGHANEVQIGQWPLNTLELKLSLNVKVNSESSSLSDQESKKLTVELEGHALKILKVAFREQLKLGLEMQFINDKNPADTYASSKMTIKTLTNCKESSGGCEGTMEFPKIPTDLWLQRDQLCTKVNIVAYLEKREKVSSKTEDVVAVNKHILNAEIGSDVQIICGEGNRVQSQSEVLQSMLLSDKKEKISKEILMDDMSLEGVTAFLAYLYYRDLDNAKKKCGIAVELIKAGNKYLIESLEKIIKELLMAKPYSWFDLDATLTLFFFASKVDGYEDLKMRAIQVLKAKPDEVESSAVLTQMFKDDPVAAREIFKAILRA